MAIAMSWRPALAPATFPRSRSSPDRRPSRFRSPFDGPSNEVICRDSGGDVHPVPEVLADAAGTHHGHCPTGRGEGGTVDDLGRGMAPRLGAGDDSESLFGRWAHGDALRTALAKLCCQARRLRTAGTSEQCLIRRSELPYPPTIRTG